MDILWVLYTVEKFYSKWQYKVVAGAKIMDKGGAGVEIK